MKKTFTFLLLLFAVLVAAHPVPAYAGDVEKYAVYAQNVLGALDDYTSAGYANYNEEHRYILLGDYNSGNWTSFWLIRFSGEAAPFYGESDEGRHIYYNTTADAQLYGYEDGVWSDYTRSGVNDAYNTFDDTYYILYSDFDIMEQNGSEVIYFPCTRLESGEATPTPTPEPEGDTTPDPSGTPDGINMDNINQVTGFADSIVDFFGFLQEVLLILFPFFTPQEINFLITMLVIFFGILAYFFIRKVLV